MSLNINLHPIGKWQKVETYLWGSQGGNCLRIVLHDEGDGTTDISIHYYGGRNGAADLLFRLRSALAALPWTEKCSCKPDCDEIIISGVIDHD